ncbi:sialin-like isoform X2 [Bacillus rossius redtenbacheri]|uniref:sialin-like isoform X2 n=1 Tax=Bacillus rossius redtenbacheri TaxID=93214 RepID=UPI002FDDC56B
MVDLEGKDAVKAALRCSPWRVPARTVFAVVLWFGAFFLGTMLGSMPITLIAMVKPTGDGTAHGVDSSTDVNISSGSLCPWPAVQEATEGASTQAPEGEFSWDAMTQSYLLTAGGYGSLASSLAGARLAEVFGPRRVLGLAFAGAALANLLCPAAARLSVWLLVALRAVQGGLMGCVMPGATILFASWIPPDERGRFSGMIFSAMIFSNLFTMLVSGNLATWLGWDAIFYFYGLMMVPFCAAWALCVYDSPLQHPRISEEERRYIVSTTKRETRKILSVPWFRILTSPVIWAIILVNVSVNWLSNTLNTELPLYMRNFLHFNINQSTYLSALPHIFQFVSNVMCGLLSQWLRTGGRLGHLAAYRVFNGVADHGEVEPRVLHRRHCVRRSVRLLPAVRLRGGAAVEQTARRRRDRRGRGQEGSLPQGVGAAIFSEKKKF